MHSIPSHSIRTKKSIAGHIGYRLSMNAESTNPNQVPSLLAESQSIRTWKPYVKSKWWNGWPCGCGHSNDQITDGWLVLKSFQRPQNWPAVPVSFRGEKWPSTCTVKWQTAPLLPCLMDGPTHLKATHFLPFQTTARPCTCKNVCNKCIDHVHWILPT